MRLSAEERCGEYHDRGYLTKLLKPCGRLTHGPPMYSSGWTGIATNGAGWTDGTLDPLTVELLDDDD